MKKLIFFTTAIFAFWKFRGLIAELIIAIFLPGGAGIDFDNEDMDSDF